MSASSVGPKFCGSKKYRIPNRVPVRCWIRIKAVGINPVDTYIRAGTYPRKPSLPYTPGTDAAGMIEAVGPNVKRFKVGDRVYTNGSVTGVSAELAVCGEPQVHPLPAERPSRRVRLWAFRMARRIARFSSAASQRLPRRS